MPAGRDVKDVGSNNEAKRDRGIMGTENLEAGSIGQMDNDSDTSDDLETTRLGSHSTVEFTSEVAELDEAKSHAKVPVAQRGTTQVKGDVTSRTRDIISNKIGSQTKKSKTI